MTIKECFQTKVATGRVDRDAGAKILDWLAEASAERIGRMTTAEAARAAAIDVADTAARLAARDADLSLRSVEAQVNVLNVVRDYREQVKVLGEGGRDARPITMRSYGLVPSRVGDARAPEIGPAIRSLLARDPHEIATGANVHYLARDIRGRAHAAFADAIEFLRPKSLGLRAEHVAEHDVLQALFGAEGTPSAKAAAEAFGRVAEDLREQFNAAGGAIPKRENWRLPQYHDADKVAAVTRESWKDVVRPLLDRADMLDFETGKPLTDDALERVLDGVHGTIATRGVTGAPTTAATGRPSLANTRTDARVLSFRNAEGWASYKDAFGPPGGVFETMMRHVGDMAEDIAQLRVLGPNPAGLKRYVESLFDREIANLSGEASAADAKSAAATVRAIRSRASGLRREKAATMNLWAHTTGEAGIPVNMELARTLGDMRSYLSATQLGSAIISSLTDLPTLANVSRFNGLPVMRIVGEAIRQMGEKGSEVNAASAGLIADSLAHVARENDRFMGETIKSGLASRAAATVIRASGLRRWTAALRNAFGMEFMAHAARLSETPFAELQPRFRDAFGRYGIDAAKWDVIRSAEAWAPREGAAFIRPMDVSALGGAEARDASERFARLINTEMDHAVIETDPTTRALLYGGTRPGTAEGEVLRAIGLYKQFPLTFMTTHFARAFARGWDGTRLAHAALSMVTMWGFGIMAMQAKQVAQGRDPYSLDPTNANGLRAWGAGLLQSGGLGIFGDALFTDKTRIGNTWASTLAGPQVAMAEDLGRFVIGNIGHSTKGEPTHFAGDALYVAARYVPGSSLWFGRLAFQRAVVDQLALMVDPRAPDRFRRMESEAQKTWAQRYWWRPGQTSPARGPDFGAMAGR